MLLLMLVVLFLVLVVVLCCWSAFVAAADSFGTGGAFALGGAVAVLVLPGVAATGAVLVALVTCVAISYKGGGSAATSPSGARQECCSSPGII